MIPGWSAAQTSIEDDSLFGAGVAHLVTHLPVVEDRVTRFQNGRHGVAAAATGFGRLSPEVGSA